MAVLRDRPYTRFNFLVDLGDGNSEGPQAGFQEIGPIGMEVEVIEYRTGNSKENGVMKLTGLQKVPDVTLKRGIIGSLALYQWLNDIRNGSQNALRTVTIQLQNEDHGDGADVEIAACPHREAHERPLQRQGRRRGNGGTRAGVRAAGDGVGEAVDRTLSWLISAIVPTASPTSWWTSATASRRRPQAASAK